MNTLQTFINEEFGEIRTVVINNKLYFVASDIAKALGYANPNKAINDHCRWVTKRDIPHPQSKTKTLKINVIPEGDLYRMVTNSELPSAEKFESWVFDKVIPEIRQTGSYQNGSQKKLSQEEIMRIQLGLIDTVDKKINTVDTKISTVENRLTTVEDTMVIDYGQQRVLAKLVSDAVLSCLGGIDTLAYKEIGRKVFAECNGNIKDAFLVNSRNNVPRVKFQVACDYIRAWKPCARTYMLILQINSASEMTTKLG